MAQAIITKRGGSNDFTLKQRTITFNKSPSNKPSSAFEINSQLKFINQSTIGSADNVNGATLRLEYSDDGIAWTQYKILESTVYNTENLDFTHRNSSYPDDLRWQYGRNNSCQFTTNEKHKYWRAQLLAGNSAYNQIIRFETAGYETVIDSETVNK